MKNLGSFNFPSKKLQEAITQCESRGHTLEMMWHGPYACLTTFFCPVCKFFYNVDSSD